ncbi:hypothetical protein NDR87_14790 [Nocardia sp. CDC159]|uniref:Thioesterase domain-containing protein n=1 Tax=Nocardia pulmonis TaxID=2951408 RepID=A0A9X2IXW5_9NOCA|nr:MULTISPECIES: hotdog domain-containing protein [Nocardia]MCM6774310.1 hypothetical protein [Nocardia pulmonis]MCM6787624.1 hypothetical protein [Nocardia sp. CDC159]
MNNSPSVCRAADEMISRLFPGDTHLRSIRIDGSHAEFVAEQRGLELRFDGVVTGPAIFRAVDICGFVTLHARLGRSTPGAVLSQCSIGYLTAAPPGDLHIAVTVEAVGQRLATATARVTDGRDEAVALATLQFAVRRTIS